VRQLRDKFGRRAERGAASICSGLGKRISEANIRDPVLEKRNSPIDDADLRGRHPGPVRGMSAPIRQHEALWGSRNAEDPSSVLFPDPVMPKIPTTAPRASKLIFSRRFTTGVMQNLHFQIRTRPDIGPGTTPSGLVSIRKDYPAPRRTRPAAVKSSVEPSSLVATLATAHKLCKSRRKQPAASPAKCGPCKYKTSAVPKEDHETKTGKNWVEVVATIDRS